MIDVMRGLGIEYIAAIPGNTFKGLHESLINYGMLTSPKIDHVTCMHEEQSVAICHGYAKIAGKPMACMMHSTVGLQHGSMAIYNAWADHAPVFAITGHQADAARRGGVVDWAHSVYDGPALVRDFTKYDDTPASMASFADAATRAYKFSMTPPYGPVLLALDQNLQENPIPRAPPIPKLPRIVPPQGEQSAVEEVARMLVAAESPVILVDRAARTDAGVGLLVQLAEALQAPVCDSYGRFNFPWRHPLAQSRQARALVSRADVVLGLEMSDFYGASNAAPKTAKRISINSADLYLKSNYQDFDRFTPVDIAMAADAEATLPALIEAVKRQTPTTRRSAFEARGKTFADAHARAIQVSKTAAAVGWDDAPITTARLCMELYGVIRNEDWSLVNGTIFQNFWPQQLWSGAEKHYQYIGDAGAYGLGYLPGAAIGAALANKPHGRLTVAIGGDGDLMFSPGVLWAMAHNNIPLLYVVHNNRAYHQELMWVQQVASRRNRGVDRCHIGNVIQDPAIDYCKMAQALGVFAEKAVTDPADLAGAFQRAVAAVKRGQPALVDVVSQGR
jgi:thiamine pyrophosphate-dependent acetolactate synthase large subunit-like protein